MLKIVSIVMFVITMIGTTQTKDFGVQGTTFDIKEPSLLELIYTKLRNLQSTNKLIDHQREIQTKVKNSIENPLPIPGIVTATSYQSRTYDPSILMDEDIKDHRGNIIVRKGTHVNPLDYHSFGKPLLFIKGEDDSQVNWAIKQGAKETCVKIVLLSGKPLHLAQMYKKSFYYDQGAILSNKFGIKAVPARVSQKEKLLLIEEFSLEGSQ